MPAPPDVAAFMIPLDQYPHVSASPPRGEAITAIRNGMEKPVLAGFRRVLIVDGTGHLVGTVAMSEVLRGLEPNILRATSEGVAQGFATPFSGESDVALELFWDRIFGDGFSHAPTNTVAEFARPITVTVGPADPLARALHRMLQHEREILPVVEDGRVLGVIRLVDIFDRIATLIGATKP